MTFFRTPSSTQTADDVLRKKANAKKAGGEKPQPQTMQRSIVVRIMSPNKPWMCPVKSCALPVATVEEGIAHLKATHPKKYVLFRQPLRWAHKVAPDGV